MAKIYTFHLNCSETFNLPNSCNLKLQLTQGSWSENFNWNKILPQCHSKINWHGTMQICLVYNILCCNVTGFHVCGTVSALNLKALAV